MKKFLFAFILVFLIGLTGIPQINHTSAACTPAGGNCAVPLGDLCCSKSCAWAGFPFPPGVGRCEASPPGSGGSGGGAESGQKQPEPPAPPCAPGAREDGKCTSVVTAFGTIGVDPGVFTARLFGILLAASGGIAVILIIRAGYQIMTARGNPEGIKEGREKIVAAIVGLMFLVFSFVILEVIGVNLLRLPDASSTFSSKKSEPTKKRLETSCSDLKGTCIPRGACTPGDGVVAGTRGCGTGTICCLSN